jgi:HSP20 family molecular chaperone IbpA
MTTIQGLRPNSLVDVPRAPTIIMKSRAWTPVADIYELDDELVIEVELSGCQSSNITAKVVKDEIPEADKTFYVVVEARREIVPNVNRRVHNERYQGDFGRVFHIPADYDPAAAKSTFSDGLLKIFLPKKPSTSPKETVIHLEGSAPRKSDRTK